MRRSATAVLLFLAALALLAAPARAYVIGYDYYNNTGVDCAQIGTWNPTTHTCTLDRDVNDTIAIWSSYVTIEGAGHTLRVPGGYGIWSEDRKGLRIRNLTVDAGYIGISLNRAHGSVIENCTVQNAGTGILLYNGGPYTVRNTRIDNVGNGFDIRFASGDFSGLDIGPAAGSGMYTWYAGGTITNSVIHDCALGINANSWRAHNNIFRDCATEIAGTSAILNVEATPAINIVGGPSIGGNYYTKSDGTGFSDTAVDVNPHDGFADQPYVFGDYKVDNLPLVIYRAYVNHPPVLAPVGDLTAAEGQTLTFALAATDPDPGDLLSYSAANLPPGASFDSASATFTWTPEFDQAGTFGGIEFTVTDSGVPPALDVEIIAITVGNTNRAPVFAPVDPQAVSEYDTLEFNLWATDPDGDAVTIQAGALPAGAVFDPVAGVFTWRPDGEQAGVYPIHFFATDDGVPPLGSESGVIITVGQVTSPVDLVRTLVAEIHARDLPEPAVNSYLANLKKVEIFVIEGKLGPAINQVEVFIDKCSRDIDQGIIPPVVGEYLLMMANDLLALLSG